ncbi:MAG: hypothetical protein AB7T06_10465 [Kofleriaceae bacterium]
MSFSLLLKGALVEYGSGLGLYVPNIVVFQFNPETITRTLQIPPRPTGATMRETSQAGDIPTEQISMTIQFTTHEPHARLAPLSLALGIGPQLAALEKMARPAPRGTSLLSKSVDKVKSLIKKGDGEASQPIPRETYPRLLFIWGTTRVLPVTLDSLSIIEKQYDTLLNPTLAEATITMTAIIPDPCSDDPVASGAYKYSTYARDALAEANLAYSSAEAVEIVSF